MLAGWTGFAIAAVGGIIMAIPGGQILGVKVAAIGGGIILMVFLACYLACYDDYWRALFTGHC